MTSVFAELRKLRRPLFLWLTLATVGIAVVASGSAQRSAAIAIERAQADVRATPHLADVYRSQKELNKAVADTNERLANVQEQAGLVGSTQLPLGALGLALGYVSSGLGLLMLLIAAGAHVGGEWSEKNIKEIFIADGRRTRFVSAKTISLFLFGCWLVLCTWVGLMVWGLISRSIYQIGSASTSATLDWMAHMLWGAPVVILLFAVFGVCASAAIRSFVGPVLAGCVVWAGLNLFVTRFDSLIPYSPAIWVASLLRFDSHLFLRDHLFWTRRGLGVPLFVSMPAIAALILALFVDAVLVVKHRDVL